MEGPWIDFNALLTQTALSACPVGPGPVASGTSLEQNILRSLLQILAGTFPEPAPEPRSGTRSAPMLAEHPKHSAVGDKSLLDLFSQNDTS